MGQTGTRPLPKDPPPIWANRANHQGLVPQTPPCLGSVWGPGQPPAAPHIGKRFLGDQMTSVEGPPTMAADLRPLFLPPPPPPPGTTSRGRGKVSWEVRIGRAGGGGGWHKASVSDCLPLAAPIGLSPLLNLTLCGPKRVLVVSTEPPDDLSCLTGRGGGWHVALGVLFSSAAGGAYWPIAIRCPSSSGTFPSPGGGAHRLLTALCPSYPSLPYPALSTSLSFPLAFPSIGRGGGDWVVRGRRAPPPAQVARG